MPRRYTLEAFIEKSNLVHNNKYDYSNVLTTLTLNVITANFTCTPH